MAKEPQIVHSFPKNPLEEVMFLESFSRVSNTWTYEFITRGMTAIFTRRKRGLPCQWNFFRNSLGWPPKT